MKISKTTYIIIFCLFIGAFGSYMYKHYFSHNSNTAQIQKQEEMHKAYTTNPINPATGIPDKGVIADNGTNGALIYQTSTSKKPYGVLDPGPVITLKKKVNNDTLEIEYKGDIYYISEASVSFDVK